MRKYGKKNAIHHAAGRDQQGTSTFNALLVLVGVVALGALSLPMLAQQFEAATLDGIGGSVVALVAEGSAPGDSGSAATAADGTANGAVLGDDNAGDRVGEQSDSAGPGVALGTTTEMTSSTLSAAYAEQGQSGSSDAARDSGGGFAWGSALKGLVKGLLYVGIGVGVTAALIMSPVAIGVAAAVAVGALMTVGAVAGTEFATCKLTGNCEGWNDTKEALALVTTPIRHPIKTVKAIYGQFGDPVVDAVVACATLNGCWDTTKDSASRLGTSVVEMGKGLAHMAYQGPVCIATGDGGACAEFAGSVALVAFPVGKFAVRPVHRWNQMRTIPRHVPRGSGLGRVRNFGVWLGSLGPLNGLRTRLRRHRFKTEPVARVPENTYYIEVSARQPVLLRGGPNVRHAHFGLRGPGDAQGQWFHLTRSDGVKSGVVRQFDGFYPGADYDIVRLAISKEAFDQALSLADDLAMRPRKLWAPPKYSCVTEACRVSGHALSVMRGETVEAPFLARVNGGTMQQWLVDQGGVHVPQALVARSSTRTSLGPLVDRLIGRPAMNDGPLAWNLWQQNRVLRLEPEFALKQN